MPETEVNQYVTQEVQDENKQQECPAHISTVLDGRKYHKLKSAYMWPQKTKICELQSRKSAIKCKKEQKEDQIAMMPQKPATKIKNLGQATHKDILQNKNCSNVNIVNIQPQKPSLSDEQFKKPATMYKYKYNKYHEEFISYDKQCQETKQSVCEVKKCPSIQCSDRKPVMKNKDMMSRELATETKSSLCNDKNCQSTRCFKKFTRCVNAKSPVRPMCNDDKNCQSVQFIQPVENWVLDVTSVHQDSPMKKPSFKTSKKGH